MIGGHGSFAKIERPRISGALQRERLFKLLDTCRDDSVTWISGPAGSGKTTLIASYIDSLKVPCLWYRLDAGDFDIATFFYYMGLAARKASPRNRKPLPLFTPEYSQGIATFTLRYFENLFMRLKPPFFIVFDNYHRVPDSSKLHKVIRDGLSILPEKIRVISISRKDPPSRLVQLRADGRMCFIGWNEIRFTFEESLEMVRIKKPKGFDDENMRHIHEKTDGWAAGLVLMTENTRLGEVENRRFPHLTPGQIFDYFADEVFEKADREAQTFLLKTAFLTEMSADSTEKLTRIERSDAILSRLNRDHFFTERSAGPAPIYRYHPLFREFLISRAKETFSPDEIFQAERSAATVLAESGRVEDAADLLIHSQDWNRLIELILTHTRRFLSQGRHATLIQWISAIPEKILERTPWILFWLGVCKLALRPSASRACLEKAFHLFEAQEDDAGTLLAWSGVVQTFLFELDDLRPLDKWIAWLDDRVGRGIAYPSREVAASVASGITGALAWRMPFHPDARTWVNTATAMSQEDLDIDTRLRACTNSAIYYLWMGEFAQCRILIEQMRKMVMDQPGPPSPARQILLKVAEAMFYNASAEFHAQADQAVSEGLAIAQKTGVHIMDTLLYLQAAASSLNEGNKEKVHEFLLKMEKTIGVNRRAHSGHYYYFLSWYFVLADDIPQAVASAKESLRFIEEAGLPVSEALIRLTLAHALYQSGNRDGAHEQLASAEKISARTGSFYCAYLCHMTAAYLSLERGDIQEGLQTLHKALVLARQKGYATTIYFWRPDVIGYLCAKAMEAGMEVEYVKNLIRKLRLSPPTSRGISIETWPWPLEIHTLGRFDLTMDGKPVQYSRKAQEKPLSLLKILIALGQREVKEEDISDILWPEADGDSAHHSFQTTLYRLRSLLGLREALQFREGRLSLDTRYCRVDAWIFEHFLQEADTHWRDGFAEKAIELTEKAIGLYKGPFLGKDMERSWTLSTGARLKSKFLRGVGNLGEHWSHAGQWEKALECYRKGLEIDDLAEGFCQGLMVCYQRLGRRIEALSLYQRFEKRLDAVLGVAPSEKTKSLRDALLKQ